MIKTAILGSALAFGAFASAQEDLQLWAHHRSFTLNTRDSAASVRADVLRFPLLVRLPAGDSIYRQASPGGADLRFSKIDDATILPHEIETWDSTGAAIWVLMDTVRAHSTTQALRLHWGRPGAASTSDGGAVFSPANGFRAVWHLRDSSSQADASGLNHTALPSPIRPAASANALIGGAKTFNGSTNWYQIGADSSFLIVDADHGPYSISAWVRPAACDARITVIAKYVNSLDVPGRHFALHTTNDWTRWRFTNDPPAMGVWDEYQEGSAEFIADAPGTCVPGKWAHLTGTYRSGAPTRDSAVNAKLYVNGVQGLPGSPSYITGASMGTAALAYIGRIATDERYMNGDLDEIRVHVVARDSDWIRLEIATQKPQAGLLSFKGGVAEPSALKAWTAARAAELRVRRTGEGLRLSVDGLGPGETARLSLVDLRGRILISHRVGAGGTWNLSRVPSGTYALRMRVLDPRGEMKKAREYRLSRLP